MKPSVLTALRPLPLAIGIMGLLVVLKLSALLQGTATPAAIMATGGTFIPAALAAEAPDAKHAPEAKQSPDKQGPEAKPGAEPHATPHAPAGQAAAPADPEPSTMHAAATPAAAPSNSPTRIVPMDPPPTDGERALLQDLRARRTALDARAQSLETREAVLAAAERRLSERFDQLGTLQKTLEALDQTRRERDEANWRGLVKTYETMRPRDAAAIFNDLDQPVLMQVLDRMKEAKAATVLAAMQPERARAATTDLAKWRTRPAPVAEP